MKDLIYSESGNLPNWAKNGKEYWETTKSQEEQVEMEFQEGKRGEKIVRFGNIDLRCQMK